LHRKPVIEVLGNGGGAGRYHRPIVEGFACDCAYLIGSAVETRAARSTCLPRVIALASVRVVQLSDVLQVLAALERRGVRYAVFGAVAMAAHGLDRATRDVDVFVAPDEENVARLREALASVFDDPSIAEISSDDLQGEYPVIQYGPPGVDFTSTS